MLEFPVEIPKCGDEVKLIITMFKSSNHSEISHRERIDGIVMHRRIWEKGSFSISLWYHTYQELIFEKGKWRCCWLTGQKHQVELSFYAKTPN